MLVEPDSARVLFANRAALEAVGDGVPLRAEAARGEQHRGVRVAWAAPAGPRTLVAGTETVAPPRAP